MDMTQTIVFVPKITTFLGIFILCNIYLCNHIHIGQKCVIVPCNIGSFKKVSSWNGLRVFINRPQVFKLIHLCHLSFEAKLNIYALKPVPYILRVKAIKLL